ncbi:MAG: 2-oxo acid dehydrogenase subunit E2 [bacterium]
MGKYWSPLERLSTWRKISVGMWAPPSDPTIYGYETLIMEDMLPYLAQVEEITGVRVSPAVIAAHALASIFGKNPDFNVMVVNRRLQKRKSVDAFLQVATKGDAGDDLSGVTIRGADEMDIVDLALVLRKKAMKVRKGQDQDIEKQKKSLNMIPIFFMRNVLQLVEFLTFSVPIDLDAIGVRSDPFGSFMVSSVAPFDIRLGFAPLVPASRCPIVALPGAIFERPMVVRGEIIAAKVMQMGVTFDHRCYDGAQIGVISRHIRGMFENPHDYLPDMDYWREKAAKMNLEPKAETPADEAAQPTLH